MYSRRGQGEASLPAKAAALVQGSTATGIQCCVVTGRRTGLERAGKWSLVPTGRTISTTPTTAHSCKDRYSSTSSIVPHGIHVLLYSYSGLYMHVCAGMERTLAASTFNVELIHQKPDPLHRSIDRCLSKRHGQRHLWPPWEFQTRVWSGWVCWLEWEKTCMLFARWNPALVARWPHAGPRCRVSLFAKLINHDQGWHINW